MKALLQISRNSDGSGFVWGDIDLNPIATFDDVKSFEDLVEKAKIKAEELISEGKYKTGNDVLRVLSASPIEVNFWGEESKSDIEIFTFKEDLSIVYENEYDHEEGGLKQLVEDGVFEDDGLLEKLESGDFEETAKMVFERLPSLESYYTKKAIKDISDIKLEWLTGSMTSEIRDCVEGFLVKQGMNPEEDNWDGSVIEDCWFWISPTPMSLSVRCVNVIKLVQSGKWDRFINVLNHNYNHALQTWGDQAIDLAESLVDSNEA